MFEAIIVPVLAGLCICGCLVVQYKARIAEIDADYRAKLRKSWRVRNDAENAAFMAQLTRERLFREYCKVEDV